MNYVRTAILLAGLTALFMGVGFLIGGQAGAMIALVIAAGMNLFGYPLSGGRMDNLFSTHPATENRIAALEQLAAHLGRGDRSRPAQAASAHAARGPWGGGARRGPWG